MFPQAPVSIGKLATATLREVSRGREGVVGRFTLEPEDHREFVDRIGALRAVIGTRYAPLPGTWASFVVPADRDDIDLLVGLDRTYGKALADAHRELRTGAKSVVPALTVRGLALGFLKRVGV